MNKTILSMLLCLLIGYSHAQNEIFSGTVLSAEDESPLPGALITIDQDKEMAIADEKGSFQLNLSNGTYQLRISYLGMKPMSLELTIPWEGSTVFKLEPDESNLEEVTVLSTGYQDLPSERATGSFASLDKELIDRRVSSNLVDRLEDVTPGLILNRGQTTGNDQISIRGRSTLFANTAPLIIVDNFPYDGPLESINPNDVESITVLKDAAAASIWGARAGNGVIVITTRTGIASSAPKVRLNSNINFIEERDLFYVPQMNIGDFVDIQQQLFENNFYRSSENSPANPALPPLVETLIQLRDGAIDQNEADRRIAGFRNSDFRNDLGQYYYRGSLNQQHSLSVQGGSQKNTYFFSLGYDKNLQGVVGNNNDRWTLQAKNSWKFLKNKLTWSVGAYLSKSASRIRTDAPQADPYTSLSDELGNPVPIFSNLSERFLNNAQSDNPDLLDWYNVPLNEIGILDQRNEQWDGRFLTGLNWNVAEGLNAELSYQYWTNQGQNRNRNPLESYFVRDLINRFSQIDEQGRLTRNIPLGDVLDLSTSRSYSHTLRGLMRYQKQLKQDHQLSLLTGFEIRDLQSEFNATRYYGYNDALGTSSVVDLVSRFPLYSNSRSETTIPQGNSHGGTIDRFISYYGNAGYTYRNKLDVTFSIRKDQSNFFGVRSNQRGVPLWSAGLGWTLSEENLFGFLSGTYLKLRGSYGFSGNLDRSLSGQMTASYFNTRSSSFIPNLPVANIVSPPNPSLSWERVGTWNVGLDYESRSGDFSLTGEFFGKKGMDLIGPFGVPAATGFIEVTGNFAETYTSGLDIIARKDWIKNKFRWTTHFLYSHVKDRVNKMDVDQSASALLSAAFSARPVPIESNPLFSIYSYQWAGLNPDNGNPQGIVDGEPSENYRDIITGASPENLVFHGPARPTHFGAIRNDFTWKGFQLSINVSYRLGYFYRKRSIDYFSLLRGQIGHGDYENRWRVPGDEANTYVPSLPENANALRHLFYSNSAALIFKGDHIRLQDIRLSYQLDRSSNLWMPFQRAEIYSYVNNVGLLWKASPDELDPDFQTQAPLRSFAIGLRIDF